MQTYQERVNRYRIYRRTTSMEHINYVRDQYGDTPQSMHGLYLSFANKEDALAALVEALAEEDQFDRPIHSYKFVDAGDAEIIERPIY